MSIISIPENFFNNLCLSLAINLTWCAVAVAVPQQSLPCVNCYGHKCIQYLQYKRFILNAPNTVKMQHTIAKTISHIAYALSKYISLFGDSKCVCHFIFFTFKRAVYMWCALNPSKTFNRSTRPDTWSFCTWR